MNGYGKIKYEAFNIVQQYFLPFPMDRAVDSLGYCFYIITMVLLCHLILRSTSEMDNLISRCEIFSDPGYVTDPKQSSIMTNL